MRKLISNESAKRIRNLHSQQEIDNGIITLGRCGIHEEMPLLKEKLLEEVNEYLHASNDEEEAEELKDVMDVCRALQGKSNKFSEGYILENTK